MCSALLNVCTEFCFKHNKRKISSILRIQLQPWENEMELVYLALPASRAYSYIVNYNAQTVIFFFANRTFKNTKCNNREIIFPFILKPTWTPQTCLEVIPHRPDFFLCKKCSLRGGGMHTGRPQGSHGFGSRPPQYSESHKFFWFPSAYKIMLTLQCRLWSTQ